MWRHLLLVSLSLLLVGIADAADKGDGYTVKIHRVSAEGVGEALGMVRVRAVDDGLVFEPELADLPPGLHGFHVHENGSCQPSLKDGKPAAAAAAGGHYAAKGHDHHGAPWGDGHAGDLPALYVAEDGRASQPVFSSRLKLEDLKNRALMIHAGGDNYADTPKPLGGGGARIACGVIR